MEPETTLGKALYNPWIRHAGLLPKVPPVPLIWQNSLAEGELLVVRWNPAKCGFRSPENRGLRAQIQEKGWGQFGLLKFLGKRDNILSNMPKPYPDIEGIQKFLEYRIKGYTYQKIATLLGKNTKTLWRWSKYDIGKLSTAKNLTLGNKGVNLKQR